MITARIVGEDAVLAWLRATPDAVAPGLARAISKLGVDLQRKIQEERTGQILAARSGSVNSSINLEIDQSGDHIAAIVSSDSRHAHLHDYGFAGALDVRENLRRMRKAFGRPVSEKTIDMRAYRRRMEPPERSFMRSALEDMDPAIRDEMEAALCEALTG